jgi:type II secretory pathway pseudopilin PulG
MIAIFIGLVMLGGIFGLVQMAMQGSKVQTAQTNLSTIRMGVQKLYTGQPNYSGLDTSTANAAGLFPESMTSGAGPVNAWSGSVQVSVGATPTRFTITFNDVPQEPCIELAKFGYGSWESVEVNGASVSQSGGGAVSDAVAACTSGGNSLVYVSQ